MAAGYETGPGAGVEATFDAGPQTGLLSPTSMSVKITTRCLSAVLTVCSVTLPLCAQPHHKKLAKEQIVKLEAQFRQAQLSGDTGVMDRLLSDDYLGISINGQISTKAQQLDRMRSHNLVLTQLDISDVKYKLLGQVAIVTSLAEVDGTLEGSPIHGMFRYTRIYQKLPNGAWKITNFEATRISARREQHIAQREGWTPTEARQ